MIRKPMLPMIDSTNWAVELCKPITARVNYHLTANSVQYSRIAARIIGVGFDETGYLIELYKISKADNVYVLSEILDKTILPERFQAIQRIYDLIQEKPSLSINRFVAFLEGAQLLPKYSDDQHFNRLVRVALIDVFTLFKENHDDAFTHPEFRRVLLDIIKWTWNHLDQWVREIPIKEDVPHIIWYGDLNKSQQYFLLYLILLGVDVVILHPEGKDDFKEIDPNNKWSMLLKNPSKMKIQPFPHEEPQQRGTVAYRATKEIEHILHHEGAAFYKPWQFREHLPVAITLKTTYDEIFLLAKEKAFIRPTFSVNTKEVRIPSLFAKISGVLVDRKEYWKKLHGLTNAPNAVTVKKFPYLQESKANNQFHYQHALGENERLDSKKIMKSNLWQYGYLHDGVQEAIAAAIVRICENPKLKAMPGERKEDISLYLFTHALLLPKELLNLMQMFDYSQDVPKIILFNNGKSGEMSRADVALLLLLNELGLDIIVYNPPGHKDLELFIDKQHFDHHLLDNMVYDLLFQEQKKDLFGRNSFLKRFFNGRN